MVFGLFVEDLCEFSTGDEGLFIAGVEGEHPNGFGEVIVHRDIDNFDWNK